MENQIKQIRRFIIMTLLIILFATFSFSVIIRKDRDDLKNKELKISSLIDEVGELKGSNLNLNNQISSKNQSLDQLNQKLELIKKNLDSIPVVKHEEIKADLAGIQNELVKSLQDNQRKISRLSIKNQNLNEEIKIASETFALQTTNFLIIGENKKLTDTMIVAAVDSNRKRITLISIPRDFYYNGRKINELYFRYGIAKTEEAIQEMTGLQIHKYVILDFEAFKKMVDLLGGIEVNVAKKLVDNAYPGPGVSYIKVSFDPGLQTMDGEKALKYARSRESTSDFDRSKRQQQIISAVAEKLRKMDFVMRLDMASNMYNAIIGYLETDINLLEAFGYYGSYKDFEVNYGNIMSTQNILKSTRNEKGQYILMTKNEGYKDIKSFTLEALKK